MSDEAERVRATLRVLDVLEFNGVPAAVVTADAVKALASLESQNQALQEEVERLKAREMPTLQRRGVATASGTTSDNAALQERAEKAEAALKAYRCEGCGHSFQETAHVYGKRTCCPDCSHGPFIVALSPTQETDPFGDLGADLRARYGTQETDPDE